MTLKPLKNGLYNIRWGKSEKVCSSEFLIKKRTGISKPAIISSPQTERRSNMPKRDYTIKLLGLEDFEVKSLDETKDKFFVTVEKPRQTHTCPNCGAITDTIHDYRIQYIKHTVLSDKKVILKYRKRRYVCESCNKRFYETSNFTPKRHQVSHQLISLILRSFNEICTYKSVSERYGVSITTVMRYYDKVNFEKNTLPAVIGLDEFKGNLDGEKFQTIITAPKVHNIIGFARSRNAQDLDIKMLSYKNADNVKLVVMDMSNIYKALVKRTFKNAEIVADKYHVVRLGNFALEAVRKKEQKKFSKEHRTKIKANKKILHKRLEDLSDEEVFKLSVMMEQMPELGKAYYLKMKYDDIFRSKDVYEAKRRISNFILEANVADIESFYKCTSALTNWITEISNIFRYKITNGYTEGCNNKTKVLKRISYGLRNYERFVKRRMQLQNNI